MVYGLLKRKEYQGLKELGHTERVPELWTINSAEFTA